MPEERKRKVTVVTFTCGHTAEFNTSAPKVGEILLCWKCAHLTMVERAEKGVNRLFRPNTSPWIEET